MRRTRVSAVTALAAVFVLTACSGSQPGESAGPPRVVASTDVWGSVAQQVAGADAQVSSVVSGTTDPHSFEPGPATVAAISDAAVVVYNGGGYDAWVSDILQQSPGVTAIDAFALLDPASVGGTTPLTEPADPADGGSRTRGTTPLTEPADSAGGGSRTRGTTPLTEPADPHVFYDLNTAKAVANRIADALAAADPPHAAAYRSRAAEFAGRADAILTKELALRDVVPDAAAVATEPVAHYLLQAAGLTDKTPIGFTNAIEQDTDPAPVDIAAMLDLITGREVSVLIFNEQTETGTTRQMRDAAQQAGIPVVDVTETLPAGTDYLDWQAGLADRLAAALRTGR